MQSIHRQEEAEVAENVKADNQLLCSLCCLLFTILYYHENRINSTSEAKCAEGSWQLESGGLSLLHALAPSGPGGPLRGGGFLAGRGGGGYDAAWAYGRVSVAFAIRGISGYKSDGLGSKNVNPSCRNRIRGLGIV